MRVLFKAQGELEQHSLLMSNFISLAVLIYSSISSIHKMLFKNKSPSFKTLKHGRSPTRHL